MEDTKKRVRVVAEKRAVLICFNVKSDKMDSNYERNKFFRGLYGWKQMVRKEDAEGNEKEYVYERHGVLGDIPHQKVDQSSFIVEEDEADKVIGFFEEWTKKVMWRTFKVLLDEDEEEDFFD
jgi:hypothetical protein